MSDNNIDEQRVEELHTLINHHNKLYYNEDKPEIDDYTYDTLMNNLKELEAAHPELITPDSPTQRVGGSAQSSFAKITHKIQMNSLRDVFDFNEVEVFVNKIKAEYPDAEFSVEPKIDGLSVSLEYHNGELTIGSTRGDGFVGEDVTANISTIQSVIKKLPISVPLLEIRGECYMPKASFAELIAEQTENDEPLAKNARNAAAGALRQKNAAITKKRKLDIMFFNVQQAPDPKYMPLSHSHADALDYLHDIGINTVSHTVVSTFPEIINCINNIGTMRNMLDYDIDGVVIKLNSIALRNEFGANAKTPNWAVAYKFPPEEKQTTLRNIELSIGRTGAITPVAIFDPIELAGTTVTRATLNNQKFISDRNIDIGDVITVRKAGDIIPEVLCVAEKRSGNQCYKLPYECPTCRTELVSTSDEGALICPNKHCPTKLFKSLIHFASKPVMNIDGLGPAIIRQLLDANLVACAADIYDLTEADLLSLDGFKAKSASNLISAIEKSKSNELWRLIKALEIDEIGTTASKELAIRFGSLQTLRFATKNELLAIDGIGETMAQNIYDAFADIDFMRNVYRLCDKGVNVSNGTADDTVGNELADWTFVITGTLPTLSRDEASALITTHGGKVSSSVSKKTDFLLAGEKAGSKLDKAQSLGVKIISESDLRDMIED